MEKNNKLIAEFMGFEEHKGSYYIQLHNSGDWVPDVELDYHTSWDWLMPVVLKCFKIDDEEGFDNLVHAVSTLNLNDTYEAVLEFIKKQND